MTFGPLHAFHSCCVLSIYLSFCPCPSCSLVSFLLLSLPSTEKPVINPFLFGSNLREGMRTSVLCSVTSGESPITIAWYKNHEVLQNVHPDIEILTLGEFTSAVRISSVRRDHSGNYTCQAKAFMRSPVSFTAELIVHGKNTL